MGNKLIIVTKENFTTIDTDKNPVHSRELMCQFNVMK